MQVSHTTCKKGKHRARETPAHTWAKKQQQQQQQQQQQRSQAGKHNAAAHLLPVFFEEQSPAATAGETSRARSKSTGAASGVEVIITRACVCVIIDTPALHNLGIRNHIPEEPDAHRQHTHCLAHTRQAAS